MKLLSSKNGLTVISSNEFRLFDRLRHENGIYEKDLNESDIYTAKQLRQRGLVLRINEHGQAKYKAYPQNAD